ncbi:hypothetical protein APS56_06845 [Pseudalgibacter alginicilyticus]|uniref:Uncharacterized protein n=1 Tax=Pseudalgibacter alginicilyticus TaxID=1736674 RepID=A0A0P0D1U0_9FLAO|nr:hypothetical protein [Pseudalgibacter alginicilyticus]ALJ04856.1 hypothetical protein APS56_06845 [Pseudalgibacter alginicilyticus]
MKVNPYVNTTSTAVEIFKTNVTHNQLANKIIADLNQLYPNYNINFDLEDCDKVLRIESDNSIHISRIIDYGNSNNVQIELIDY